MINYTVENFLANYKDSEILIHPNPGNGGDALIAAGTLDLFERLGMNFKLINSAEHIDLNDRIVFYSGGGNLVKEYSNCADFLRLNSKICQEIIILPHTVNGHKELLTELGSNVTIFCREQVSYQYLINLKLKCKIFIDDDMAFHINLASLSKFSTNYPYRIYLNIIKSKLKSLKFDFYQLQAKRTDVEKTSNSLKPDNIDLSVIINYEWEMSDPKLIRQTAADIMKILGFFKTINTNRLHIAIAGGILGKKVNFTANSYYKNKAVFDYSIKRNFPLVKFYE